MGSEVVTPRAAPLVSGRIGPRQAHGGRVWIGKVEGRAEDALGLPHPLPRRMAGVPPGSLEPPET